MKLQDGKRFTATLSRTTLSGLMLMLAVIGAVALYVPEDLGTAVLATGSQQPAEPDELTSSSRTPAAALERNRIEVKDTERAAAAVSTSELAVSSSTSISRSTTSTTTQRRPPTTIQNNSNQNRDDQDTSSTTSTTKVTSQAAGSYGLTDPNRLTALNSRGDEGTVHKVQSPTHPWCTTTANGCLIEDKLIYGCLRIETPNVTIRNTTIECYRSRDIGNDNSYYTAALTITSAAEGTVVENSHITCRPKDSAPDTAPCDVGLILRTGIARHNEIIGAVDGIDPTGSVDAIIDHNHIHGLTVVWEEWRNDHSHADAIQIHTAAAPAQNLQITNNLFEAPATRSQVTEHLQVILITGASTVLIESNEIVGRWDSLRFSCLNGAKCEIGYNVFDNALQGSTIIDNKSGVTHQTNRFKDGTPVT